MAPPLSAGFIIMSLLLRKFVNAWISVGGIFFCDNLPAWPDLSTPVIIALMKVS